MLEDYAFRVAVSLSYICLFIVLTLYKYEVIFRTGVILVAAIGFFFPILYGLPYFFVAWRVLVGLNVVTDQKLYIARRITEHIDMDKADFYSSTTLNHWAVVIQNGDQYFYTHAVGNVVFGRGRKIPFTKIEKDKLENYRLDPVGSVTQKQRETKTSDLVDAEPMVSGNSCQEYAVDIAFHLSSSRTYTFVKTMALPRVRNTVFYSALIFSIVFIALGHPLAVVLNPLFLTNLYVALELSRIGLHNQTQKIHRLYILSVIRAYIKYPTRGNFFVLLLICVSFAYFYQRLGIEECIVIFSLLSMIILMLMR